MKLCDSDHPECSGINPCPKCFARILTKVLPPLMRAFKLSNTKEHAEHFFKMYVSSCQNMLREKVAEIEAVTSAVPAAPVVPQSAVESNGQPVATTSQPDVTLPKKGTKLVRGDLKRLAEKQAKAHTAEQVANGKNNPIPDGKDLEEKH